jgi:O-antigen ligase
MVIRSHIAGRLYHFAKPALKQRTGQLFAAVIAYYGLLVFCPSNLVYFVLTGAFLLAVIRITGSLTTGMFLTAIAVLPVNKIKSIDVPVLHHTLVELKTPDDLTYYVGISLSDALLAAALSVHVRLRIVNGRRVAYPSPLLYLVLFFVCGLVSALVSPITEISLYAAAQLFKACIAYAAASILWIGLADIPAVLSVLSGIAVFEIAWGTMQYVSGGNLGMFIESQAVGKLAGENTDLFRISGTFVDPDLYGTFILMVALALTVALIRRQLPDWLSRIAPWLIGGCAVAIIFTANRGLYLWGVLSVLTVVAVYRRRLTGFRLTRRIALWMAGVGALAIILVIPYTTERLVTLADFFSPIGSGTFRLQMVDATTRLGLDSPFGVGLLATPYYFATAFAGENLIFSVDYPHNLFFQIFAEMGIVGLVVFFAFLYRSFRPLFLKAADHPGAPLYFAALGYLTAAQFYPLFLDNMELFTLFLLLLGTAAAVADP